jgi:ribose transport system permease protein
MGAIFLVMIDNGLNLISASPFIYDVVRGAVLIGAVLIDRAAAVQLFKTGLPFLRQAETRQSARS